MSLTANNNEINNIQLIITSFVQRQIRSSASRSTQANLEGVRGQDNQEATNTMSECHRGDYARDSGAADDEGLPVHCPPQGGVRNQDRVHTHSRTVSAVVVVLISCFMFIPFQGRRWRAAEDLGRRGVHTRGCVSPYHVADCAWHSTIALAQHRSSRSKGEHTHTHTHDCLEQFN